MDGRNVELFQKLKIGQMEKQETLISVWNRIKNAYPTVMSGSPHFDTFYNMQDKLSNNPLYGFKYDSLGFNYHNVKKTSSNLQFRCSECRMATEPFYFVADAKSAQQFLDALEEITAELLIEDPVDIGDYDPKDPPPEPTNYRCHFEDMRHQERELKRWWQEKLHDDEAKAAFVDEVFEKVSTTKNKGEAKRCLLNCLWPEDGTSSTDQHDGTSASSSALPITDVPDAAAVQSWSTGSRNTAAHWFAQGGSRSGSDFGGSAPSRGSAEAGYHYQ